MAFQRTGEALVVRVGGTRLALALLAVVVRVATRQGRKRIRRPALGRSGEAKVPSGR